MIDHRTYYSNHRNAVFAIACSVLLHWAAVRGITISLTHGPNREMAAGEMIHATLVLPESSLAFPKEQQSTDAFPAESSLENPDAITAGSKTPHASDLVTLPMSPMRYFTRHEVDVAANPVFAPPLLYPERAFHSKLSGKVRIRLFISETGTVDFAEAVETIPTHQPFTDSALASAKNTIFMPAIMDGQKVRSQKLIEVIFNADEDRPQQ